jgi:hypothetical protein
VLCSSQKLFGSCVWMLVSAEPNATNLNMRFRFGVQENTWTKPKLEFSVRRKGPRTRTELNFGNAISESGLHSVIIRCYLPHLAIVKRGEMATIYLDGHHASLLRCLAAVSRALKGGVFHGLSSNFKFQMLSSPLLPTMWPLRKSRFHRC